MPKVSVIVPIYNAEKYLEQCLDSIIVQTLNDIEIICVDDGSTDGSAIILERYAVKDSRIKVIRRENTGYGSAMNAGLDTARGEYIGIVESDDCIKAEMYQTLYDVAVKDNLDLVKSDAFYWLEELGYTMKIHYQRLDGYYDRILYDEDRNIFFDFYMNIWTGIYKRVFLLENGIRFNESQGASYQDNGFWIQTLSYCKSARWISQAFYLYRQDNPTASVKSQCKMMAMTKEYEFLEKVLLDRQDYHLLSYCCYYRLFRHRGTFMRIADERKREFCEQIKKDYMYYKGYVRGNAGLDKWLREVAMKPDEICDAAISKKQRIKNRLEKAENIIIYGVGRRGDIVFRGLFNEGYYGKLCCFAQSWPSETREQLAGREILSIKEAHRLYPAALIIIAVVRGSGMYCQMVETLEKMDITDHMDGSDIEENFYIV